MALNPNILVFKVAMQIPGTLSLTTWYYDWYHQPVDATDIEALSDTLARNIAGFHADIVFLEQISVQTAAKGDKVFYNKSYHVRGGVAVQGVLLPLFNTVFSTIKAASGRASYHHWRLPLSDQDLAGTDDIEPARLNQVNQGVGTILSQSANWCKSNGVLLTTNVSSDSRIHMRQTNAKTPRGGRPGRGGQLARRKTPLEGDVL